MRKMVLLSFLAILISSSAANVNAAISHETTIEKISRAIAATTKNLNPSVLKLAMNAFYSAPHAGIHTAKPIVTVIDYSLPSTQKRLWVIDLSQEKVLYTSLVAHGKYSGENFTTSFSNRPGSLQTSLGVFLTENTYFGRDGYSLKIKGLEEGFNNNAKSRTIVMHGAPYVSEKFASTWGRLGRSWGCPAVEKPLAEPIINTIKGGTLVFSYYPDSTYLQKSKLINYQA